MHKETPTYLYSNDQVDCDINLEANEWYNVVEFKCDDEFESFFEIPRILAWVREGNYKKTALQMPDGLLKHAYRLCHVLEAACEGLKTFILADTTYQSCCVDSITAQHANCDSLVHFGETCLTSSIKCIPHIYVFGKLPINMVDFEIKIDDLFRTKAITAKSIYLLYDAVLCYCVTDLKNAIESSMDKDCTLKLCELVDSTSSLGLEHLQSNTIGRQIPKELKTESDTERVIIFVGTQNSCLLPVWLMTFNCFSTYVRYVPLTKEIIHESSHANRQLRKRLFLVEKLRDANVVGLIVGTLDVTDYKIAIQRIRQLCKATNKKLYVLSIGRLNEAKLSNFAHEIEVFILLSCPLGIVLNTCDFYKPILNLFEAEVALNPSRSWYAGPGWNAEFKTFLNDKIGTQMNDEGGDISLITGKVRNNIPIEREETNPNSQSQQLTQYTANDNFVNRSWKGLEDDNREDEDLNLKHGLKGLSLSYSTTEK